jgi:DNA-binding XRE family transcriptional regulator
VRYYRQQVNASIEEASQITTDVILFTYLTTVITGFQLRAARDLLGWDAQSTLAKAAGVSVGTIRRMEGSGDKPVIANTVSYDKVMRALNNEGIEFVNDGAPGVKVHTSRRRKKKI